MDNSLISFSVFYDFLVELWVLFKQPKFRSILVWMVILVVVGTIFYSLAEDWSLLDSLYFCIVTLATVGYGDLAPITPAGKVFSIIYMIIGLAMIAVSVRLLASQRQVIHAQRTGGSPGDGE